MSIHEALTTFRRGRTVASKSTGEIIGTIEGTSLGGRTLRGYNRLTLMVSVRKSDGTVSMNPYDSRSLNVI